MPYDPDTGVAEGLLHILDRTIGRQEAGVLLHDLLERPNDGATRLALTRASRARISIEQTIVKDRQATRVGFKTKVGTTKWDGDSIEIPTIPAALAIGVVGRPLSTVIGHPMLTTAPITDSTADQGRRLIIQRRDASMRDLRPGWLARTLGGSRRMARRAGLASQLHAHHGMTPGVVALSALIGTMAFALVGTALWLITGNGGTHPNAIAVVAGVAAAALTARIAAGATLKTDVVAEFVERAMSDIVSEGHGGSDEFDDAS